MTVIGSASDIRTQSDMNATPVNSGQSEMGSQDFLTLLTTQLQNQDPLSPMENAEFLSQLAQMSTVRGIDDMNSSLTGIASQLSGTRISEASSLLGQRALVPGSTVQASNGRVDGRVGLDEDMDDVTVSFSNAETGEILHTRSYGAQAAGPMDFSWEDAPTDGTEIRVSASVRGVNGTHDASTAVYAQIEGVEFDPSSNDMTLQVRGYGFYMGSEITALR
ncbi:MAG: flagellar biosynthesis protein FlgD [Thalassovita sp.]